MDVLGSLRKNANIILNRVSIPYRLDDYSNAQISDFIQSDIIPLKIKNYNDALFIFTEVFEMDPLKLMEEHDLKELYTIVQELCSICSQNNTN